MGRSRSNSRSPSRSRSQSRENSRSRSRGRSASRSRSRSNERRDRSVDRSRSRSRSPRGSGGGGHSSKYGRDNPPPSRCLGVFNLSNYTTEKDLKEVFGEFGDIDRVELVYDRPSGNSRGFGFVYFADVHDATAARDKLTNTDLDGHKIRVDYSFTKRGHSPTPGQYMGERDRRRRERYHDRGYERSSRHGGRSSGSRRPYDPNYRRRVESYASGVSSRRRSRSRS